MYEEQSNNWHGSLNLVYAQQQGKTQIIHSQMKAPLKVQRPFYPEDEVCHSIVLHTAGGIVGGDRNEWYITQNLTLIAKLASEVLTYLNFGLHCRN